MAAADQPINQDGQYEYSEVNQSSTLVQAAGQPDGVIAGKKRRGISSWSAKTKLFASIGGFVVVVGLGFGGYSLWQNLISGAAGEEYLGDTSIVNAPQTGLREAPVTPLFSLQESTVALKEVPAGEGVSSTSPYPGNGTYRIARTKAPMDSGSWEQASGTEVVKTYDVKKATWVTTATPRYDPKGGSKFWGGEQPGDVYYYRAERFNDNTGQWDAVGETVSYTVPKATLTVALPDYGEASRYIAPKDNSVDVLQNPIITVTWTGNGDGKNGALKLTGALSYPSMIVSSTKDMQSVDYHPVYNTTSGDEYVKEDNAKAAIGQVPNSTRYYAVYDHKSQSRLLSNILEVKTPALKKAPDAISLKSMSDSINGNGTFYAARTLEIAGSAEVPPEFTLGSVTDSHKNGQYIWERSTKSDAVYRQGDANTKRFESRGTLTDNGDSTLKPDVAYYYRVKPAYGDGKWTYSGQEWSQILKVEPSKNAKVVTYAKPTMSVKSIAHNSFAYTTAFASMDKREMKLQISTDNKKFTDKDTVRKAGAGTASSLKVNTTYYVRLAYYPTNVATAVSYTSSIKVKTLTDPKDASHLSCSLSVPSTIKQGQKLTASVVVKNATGTSTYTGKDHVGVRFDGDKKTTFTGYQFPWSSTALSSIASAKSTTKTLSATIDKKAKKGKKKIKVTASMSTAPKTGSCAKPLVKYIEIK